MVIAIRLGYKKQNQTFRSTSGFDGKESHADLGVKMAKSGTLIIFYVTLPVFCDTMTYTHAGKTLAA